MSKKVTVTDTSGATVTASVSDDDTAREYEALPFETEHIACVTVTDDTDQNR